MSQPSPKRKIVKERYLVYLLIAFLLTAGTARGAVPVKVIFDTDMAGDCDDCGALAVLNKLADLGEAEILACVADSNERQKSVAASISAINTYYGRPNIPIGTCHTPGGTVIDGPYADDLREKFPQHALPDDQEPDALAVYRSALASAPDGSVTVISVGFFSNLRVLLQSQPDSVSPLSGMDLVRAKVKQLVVMGGRFPMSDPIYGEYNFSVSVPADTQFVVSRWPTPILFSGFEIGQKVIAGQVLASAPATNPVRRAYEFLTKGNLARGRPSWDLTAVLAAVRDPHTYWDISPSGTVVVSAIGTDKWISAPNAGRSYLIQKTPAQDNIEKVLNDFLAMPPGSGVKVGQ